MELECEILALVLDNSDRRPATAAQLAQTAQCLVRDAAGHMRLTAVESEEAFDRTARTTGCFRRGKAIRDPSSHQVIGYEMEQVTLREATAGR